VVTYQPDSEWVTIVLPGMNPISMKANKGGNREVTIVLHIKKTVFPA